MGLLDSLLLVTGMMIITMGVQPMLDPSVRSSPTKVVNSILLVIFGIFIIYFWNQLGSGPMPVLAPVPVSNNIHRVA